MTELLTANATSDKPEADEFYDAESQDPATTSNLGPLGSNFEFRIPSAEQVPTETKQDLGKVAVEETGLEFTTPNQSQAAGSESVPSSAEEHELAS